MTDPLRGQSMVAGPEARESNLKGAGLLLAAGVIFTIEAILLRLLGDRVNAGQIIVFRAFSQLVFVGGFLLLTRGFRVAATARLGVHAVRGALSTASWGLYYASFAFLDMALATTLSFTGSLFVVALAGPLLAERVGLARWAATLAGLVGVAIVTRVGGAGFDPMVLAGLAASLLGAFIVLLNRSLTRTESTATIMFYIGIVSTIVAIPTAWAAWKPLSQHDLAIGMVIGLIGTFGMWCNIEAYRLGEASALAPYPYVRLIFAMIAGYALFAEVPGVTTIVGAAVIVAAVLGLTYHEARRRKALLEAG